MPILQSPGAELTPAQLAVERIQRITTETWAAMVRAQNDGIAAVWENDNCTPQEVCDELGEDAVAIFDYHAALTKLIVTQAAIDGITPPVKLPTHAFTRNPDGTVTVLEGAYEPA